MNPNGGLTPEACETIDLRIRELHAKGNHEAARKLDKDANEAHRLGMELGYFLTPKPEWDYKNGWRIPKSGTLSRQIYELMVLGYEWKDIHKKLGGSAKIIAGIISRICHGRR